MITLKYCITHPRGKKTHQQIKRFFVHTDLVGEGQLWIGGIVSFAILFLCISSYVFSGFYYRRYPIENSHGNLAFGCHPTLTNAQFSTGLMSLMVPPNDDELPIFELLDAQPLTLNIDFVNTLFDCTDMTVTQIKDKILPLPISSCSNRDGSLSLSVLLPSHGVNLQFLLVGINTIGGVRLALQGPGIEQEDDSPEASSVLVDLDFAQFFSFSGHILTQRPSLIMQLTKVVNRTYPLNEHGQKQLRAFWLPYVSVDVNQIFADENEYTYAMSSNTIISLVISETPFYLQCDIGGDIMKLKKIYLHE
ncbi:unnamed protein product [Rotaria sp. Silwood2]|nr:unnamed protein product [Rotaria sp. Silwood2]CAF4357885.1 unnamed protein product [Rotaria sp. Silwood2]